jgi:kynurenine formamidase
MSKDNYGGDSMKVHDFTMVIGPDMNAIWPGHPSPKLETFTTFENQGYEARIITMDSHAGTHIDAPKHIVCGKRGIDEIPIDHLVAEGVILDLPVGPYEEISAKDLQEANPGIQDGDIVLIHCGWGHKWVEPWDEELFKSRPGISTEAARWLVSKKVKAVGIDNMTISAGRAVELDPGSPSVHRILCGNDVIIAECLVNLKSLAGQRAIIAIGVIPVKGSDGFPARVFAIQL